jgi:hypothetical protein
MLLFVLLAVLTDPSAFVQKLYENDRAGVADPVFDAKSKAQLLLVFDEPLAELIWRDLVEARGEVGRMDGHYLYDAQDDEISKLEVRTLENKDGRARVRATFAIGAELRAVDFHLNRIDGAWHVADITYGAKKKSWYDILSEPSPKTCAVFTAAPLDAPEGYGATELAELYANEQGDFGAAIHFLCRADRDVSAVDRASMIAHVQRMQRGETKEPLDLCDHVTSGHGMHECALRLQAELEPALRTRYEAIPKTPALEKLRKRADEYIEHDSLWETEQSLGEVIYPSMAILTRLDREEAFVKMLEQYSTQRAPVATRDELRKADRELFRALDDLPDDHQFRVAHHAWASYRKAWIAWYQERWRGAAPPRELRWEIETALTKARVEMLR